MMSSNNILSPANGEPIIVPSQDVVLGIYYMTRERVDARGEGMVFSDVEEVHRAYESGSVDLHAKIRVRIREHDRRCRRRASSRATTVGRALLSEILPDGMPFEQINRTMNKRAISATINACYRQLGLEGDRRVRRPAHVHGLPLRDSRRRVVRRQRHGRARREEPASLQSAESEVKDIQDQYAAGLVTDGERYNKVVDIWSRTNDQVAKAMMEKLGVETVARATARQASRSRSTRST